jgi:hypothetical protein
MDAIRQCSFQIIVVFLDFRGRGPVFGGKPFLMPFVELFSDGSGNELARLPGLNLSL